MTMCTVEGHMVLMAQSEWKVRVLMFHTKQMPDNDLTINDWLWLDERTKHGNPLEVNRGHQNVPIGISSRVWPAEEFVCEDDSVDRTYDCYLPWKEWTHPTMHFS